MKRVLIIGGGISGLATAHRLTELGHENNQPLNIRLLEASERLGGIIQTTHRKGFQIERGPDSFISEKPEAVQLARRLGIDERLVHTNERFRRSFIVRKGRLRSVPEGFQLLAPSRLWPFITSDIFSVSGKLRMAADLFIPRARSNGNDDESLASFVRRRFGNEALERMAQPMVGGIYTADPHKLSLRATLPRFLEMEREHRSIIIAMFRKRKRETDPPEAASVSGARYSLFLSFDRGMQVLTDELSKRIISAGVSLQLNTKVTSLQLEQSETTEQWVVTTVAGERLTAEAVCIALPAHAAAQLVTGISKRLSAVLAEIDYASTATVNLAYRREDVRHPLNGFGFVVPIVEKRSLIACTFSSVKFLGRAPDKHVLLRAFVGGALQPDIFELDEVDMVCRVKTDLNQLLGIKTEPIFTETTRWSRSMPQFEIGHLARVNAIERELVQIPTLALSGNSYNGAGIPDCIRSGGTAAQKLFNGLKQP